MTGINVEMTRSADLFAGSQLNLTCSVKLLLSVQVSRPLRLRVMSVQWFRGNLSLSSDESGGMRVGVVERVGFDTYWSTLVLSSLSEREEGEYRCDVNVESYDRIPLFTGSTNTTITIVPGELWVWQKWGGAKMGRG